MGARALAAAALVFAACDIRAGLRQGDDDDGGTTGLCGNNALDPGEICDDGNSADGDGCSARCDSDETCGNGYADVALAESCDDGNLNSGDGCSADCKSDETCGNGVLDTSKGETCDVGDNRPGDGCSANCQSNEQCGNGTVDIGTNPIELCDGGVAGDASCDPDCTPAECGDRTVNSFANEDCDDGNGVDTDACVGCVAAFCGDGHLFVGQESCDDGNNDSGDGCAPDCRFEPRTYLIAAGGLINQASSCDGTGNNLYDGCNQQPTGFTWQDTTPFTPSAVLLEFDNGINCFNVQDSATQQAAPDTRSTTLNAVSSGTFDTLPGNCFCDPVNGTNPHNNNAWMLVDVSGYVVGGANTLMVSAAPASDSGINIGTNCFGYSNVLFGGSFARITVFP
jgi:cysteine-rich repeat protein